MDLSKNKKGQADGGGVYGLVGVIIAIAVVGILLAIMIFVLTTLNTSIGGSLGANGTVTNNVSQGIIPSIGALLNIPSWLGLLVTVIVASLVIALVMGAFAYVKGRGE